MSSKLTSKKLDLLIEQVLMEKKIPLELYKGANPTNKDIRQALAAKEGPPYLPTKIIDKIVAYAKLDGEAKVLELSDLVKAYSDNPEEFVNTISQVIKFSEDEEMKKSILAVYQDIKSDIDKTGGEITQSNAADLDLEDVKTLTFPRPFTSSASISAGKFFGAQNDLITGIFTEGNIEDRLLKASQISEKVFAAQTELESMTPRQLTQYSMFIDFVNAIINEADSRTSTYAFESLCAILCGGKVVGAGNGAADFLAAGGGKGSSKLFSNWAGIKQAASGFYDFPNEPFHYVIALLNKEQMNEDDDDGIDTRKVVNIDLHYMVVTYVTKTDDNNVKEAGFVTSNSKGEFISYQKASTSQVDLTNVPHQEMSKVGTLILYTGNNSFKDHLNNQLKDSETNQAKALKAVEQYFLNLRKAEDNTKSYIAKSSDKPKDVLSSGNAALETFDAADGFLVALLDILSPGEQKVSGDRGDRKIQENKTKSLKDLDKLIEHVILNKMNK